MKKAEIEVGGYYIAKVSGDAFCVVRIDGPHYSKGWNATNLKTRRSIHIKSAQRLRRKATENEVARAGQVRF